MQEVLLDQIIFLQKKRRKEKQKLKCCCWPQHAPTLQLTCLEQLPVGTTLTSTKLAAHLPALSFYLTRLGSALLSPTSQVVFSM
jgi:hypothetical protein